MSVETPAPLPEETPAPQEVPADRGVGVGRSPIPARTGARTAAGLLVALLSILVLALGAYSYHQRTVAGELAATNRAMEASLDATRDQLTALTAKVNEIETKPSPEAGAQPETGTQPLPRVNRRPLKSAVARHKAAVDDRRLKKMQGELDEQGREIASTREDLEGTRTELAGSIATTHDELVLLEKKGERNYFEFDMDKGNGFERQGPIRIRLRKANTKHAYADLELMVDDIKVSKKHVNIDEPVIFYPGEERTPVELVINSVGKNHIHGYVSEPKYKRADFEAMANSGDNAQSATAAGDQASSSAKPSPARRKLELTSPSR